MSKVITFSRVFPKYHPKAGQPTYFIEKIWQASSSECVYERPGLMDEMVNFIRRGSELIWPKYHTIRKGHWWKAGDKFSPRVWSGKPYNSKQLIISKDIEIVKVWDISINNTYKVNGKNQSFAHLEVIAHNDGLEVYDFLHWFPTSHFDGQIICWNNDINY